MENAQRLLECDLERAPTYSDTSHFSCPPSVWTYIIDVVPYSDKSKVHTAHLCIVPVK